MFRFRHTNSKHCPMICPQHPWSCGSKGGETDGHTQGYKDPPVSGRLVGDARSHQACLQHTQDLVKICQELGWLLNFRETLAGTKAGFQLHRLPVRPQDQLGPTRTGAVEKSTGKDTVTATATGLSGPAVHVSDRFTNSHREAGSPRPPLYEANTVTSEKQLESTRNTRKGHSNTQVPAPTLTMVSGGKQCASRSTITPNKTCSANLYRCIKRKVGRSLKRTNCKRVLVSARKQTAYKLPGTKSSFF